MRNSGQPNTTTESPVELIHKYSNLPSKFYTVDYAELENGEWIILETGDGGVSGIPDGIDYREFFRALSVGLL